MNGRVLLLAAALVLLLAVGVAAQGDTGTRRQGDVETAASTTYSLAWWTVDGGGASYNSTGSYILGGTAGQPDAAVPRSGGRTLSTRCAPASGSRRASPRPS